MRKRGVAINLLVSAVAMALGIFVLASPAQAVKVWGSEKLHKLNPDQDDRERRVLLGIVNGLTNEKIGENIGMSESAVKNVVQRWFDRTGVRRRSQLVRAALEGSLVTIDELGSYRTGRTADASSSHS